MSVFYDVLMEKTASSKIRKGKKVRDLLLRMNEGEGSATRYELKLLKEMHPEVFDVDGKITSREALSKLNDSYIGTAPEGRRSFADRYNAYHDKISETGDTPRPYARVRDNGHVDLNRYMDQLPELEPQPPTPPKAQPSPQPKAQPSPQQQSNLKRNLLLAGAGLTTAGGAGYMYHRRNKKRSEQR